MSSQDPASAAALASAGPGTEAAAVPAPGAALAVRSLVDDLAEVAAARAIACVTAPDSATATAAVERALAECDAAAGLAVVQVRAGAPRDRSAMARSLYTALGLQARRPRPRVLADTEDLIVAELRRSARLVIVPDAHQLRTPALELLYGLWANGVRDRFPLVLTGDDRLDAVLRRPALAGLLAGRESHVLIRHHLPAAAAVSASAVPDATPGAAPAPGARPGSGAAPYGADAVAAPAAVPAPAATPGPSAVVVSSPASGPGSAAASAPLLVTVARKALYQLVDAARDEGRTTLITKGRTTVALLPLARLDPVSRARVGSWPSWARTAARPKLGDLVRDAAGTPTAPGVPQVLKDRSTPVAV
ncbi:hypothetical protein, partial [Streptomyces sp. NPDC020667]|uniref:hypothetical protein n=1 Tax=Streptomyces sp. NPDC020667 TaxID=3154895 RepID=UPI00340AAB42